MPIKPPTAELSRIPNDFPLATLPCGGRDAPAALPDRILAYLLDGCCQGVALRAADFDFGKLAELDNCLGEIEDVVASLEEAVEPHEEGIILGGGKERGGARRGHGTCPWSSFPGGRVWLVSARGSLSYLCLSHPRQYLNPPWICWTLGVGCSLVVKVGALEHAAHQERGLELIDGLRCILLLDEGEDLFPAAVSTSLEDEAVTDLSHEHHQPCRCVVVPAVFPYQEDDVKHRLE